MLCLAHVIKNSFLVDTFHLSVHTSFFAFFRCLLDPNLSWFYRSFVVIRVIFVAVFVCEDYNSAFHFSKARLKTRAKVSAEIPS